MPSRLTVVYCTQQHCPHILKGFDALNTILYYVCGSCLYLNLLTISSLGDCLDYVQPSKHCLVGTANGVISMHAQGSKSAIYLRCAAQFSRVFST